MLKPLTAAALIVLGAGALASALAGCTTLSTEAPSASSASSAPSTAPPGSAAPPVYADSELIDRAASFVSIDYDPLQSNQEIAAISDVVAMGTIVGVQAGPAFGRFDDEMTDISSVVIEVRPDKVVQGGLGGASLYLSMLSPDGFTLDDWNRAYPAGVGAVVYADRSPEGAEGATGGIDTEKWQAGRPEGVALFVPNVQGFVVQIDEKHLVWPLIGVTREAPLTEALPGGSAVGVDPNDAPRPK